MVTIVEFAMSTRTRNDPPNPLLQLLSNTLILYHTTPYLPSYSILALGATSTSFRTLIHHTPGVFRYLDLSRFKSAQFDIPAIDHGGEVWRNVQLDESVTPDDFYGGPLLGIFNQIRKRNILQDVQTLILDGLSVTSEIVREILCNDSFNVRILSIREVKYLNERKLQQTLQYAIRPTRITRTKLEALYIFGPKDITPTSRFQKHVDRYSEALLHNIQPSYEGVIYLQGAQIGASWNQKSENALVHTLQSDNKWYRKSGKLFTKPPSSDWADIISSCRGIISFDAVLCSGPRHAIRASRPKGENVGPWYHSTSAYLPPRIATHAVGGCCKCNTAPEGFSKFGRSPMEDFPILSPPPIHTSTAKAAKTPSVEDTLDKKLLVRCAECIQNRYCQSCHKWWCEDCYEIPGLTSLPTTPPQSWESLGSTSGSQLNKHVKVHMNLCVEECLLAETTS